jgi:sulfatase modifying factor 1
VTRESGWKWAITNGEEWYKAAYHKNDGVTENYFDYPTSSDDIPDNALIDPDPGNNANFRDGQVYTIGAPYWRTEVGEFENSNSPYGTFDQGGNVWEWTESIFEDSQASYRVFLGGSYVDGYALMNSTPTYFFLGLPSHGYANAGFRVSQVPEPATIVLLILGVVGVSAIWRRKNR